MNYTVRNLMIAIFLLFAGIMLAVSFINAERSKIERGQDKIEVWRVANDVPAGTQASVLEEEGYVELDTMLREDAPPEVVGDLKDVEELAATEPLYAGEILTRAQFRTESRLNPTEQIKGTERYFALRVNPSENVANLVKPGDHVDFFGTIPLQGGTFQSFFVRDVIVRQTPASIAPPAEGEEPAGGPIDATGDPQVYVFQADDRTMARLMYLQSASDDYGIRMSLRPSQGAAETATPPMYGPAGIDPDPEDASPQVFVPEKGTT